MPIEPTPALLEKADPISMQEILAFIERLASLKGEFANLVEAPLDATLTTKQMARWLQLSPKEINAKAKAGLIPGIPTNAARTHFRFHPRSVIAHGHALFNKRNRK